MPLVLPLKLAAARLAAVCENSGAEAEWLMAHVLACTRTGLLQRNASAEDLRAFEASIKRRLAGEPLAYITGEQPFRSLSLKVTPEVLIPRPETEQVVDWALEFLHAQSGPQRVLDVCTGSGCIALAIATEAVGSEVWASEISLPALAIARLNAERLGAQVQFLAADGLALPESTPSFNLIVSNPPYIADHDAHLAALHHEPHLALVSGSDGLALIRRLVAEAPRWLNPGGMLLLEHGYDQASTVRSLMTQAGLVDVRSRQDYSLIERATMGCKPA